MKTRYLFALVAVTLLSVPFGVLAQGVSLSVTPTLFEMSAVPLQAWNSSVKVINNNEQELTVYAEVVNFAPQGETGNGKFLPVFEDFTEGKTLAEWITVPDGPVIIAKEASAQIPVVINVPEDAAPGGHYAAIMIGTRPPAGNSSVKVQTSQVVTSLFFVRIAGDVAENGVVRTFRTTDSFVSEPEVDFEVRFENKGNVHLQPQGEIVITNMWGKERGVVPINHRTHFGNVLPESIRKFEFNWKGEQSITDIGRYKAKLTLGYGTDARKFVTRSTSFWVVPVKAVLITLGSFLLGVWFVSWCIRSYVRRMLSMEGVQTYVSPSQRNLQQAPEKGDVVIKQRASATAPIRSGVDDLKERLSQVHAFIDTAKTILGFILSYKTFFAAAGVLILIAVGIWYYFSSVTTQLRDYEVTIENPDKNITISSEEILYDREDTPEAVTSEHTQEILPEQTYVLTLINSSDVPGAAAKLQRKLESEGYSIAGLESDFGESRDKTVIVFDTLLQEEALELSGILDGALPSAQAVGNPESAMISIYIGNDITDTLEGE